MMLRKCLRVCLCASAIVASIGLLASVGMQFAWAEPPGEVFRYKTIGERELRIYVTKPPGWAEGDRRPAIVFFHGGGWTGGAPGQFTEHAKYFASRGLVCFQVEYRLLDKENKAPPVTCTEDAMDAMTWVRGKATTFALDPDRIASAGGSAGGHLAAYVGCGDPKNSETADKNVEAKTESKTAKSNAMLLFNPVYDNGPGGWGAQRVGDRYPEFSPLHNLSADDPPSIVFLGAKDALVPVETAEKFRDRCLELGVQSELHVYEGQPHGFFNHGRSGNVYYHKTVFAADEFLQGLDWLSGPATISETPLEKVEPPDAQTEVDSTVGTSLP